MLFLISMSCSSPLSSILGDLSALNCGMLRFARVSLLVCILWFFFLPGAEGSLDVVLRRCSVGAWLVLLCASFAASLRRRLAG